LSEKIPPPEGDKNAAKRIVEIFNDRKCWALYLKTLEVKLDGKYKKKY
jgi:hypothetical protein